MPAVNVTPDDLKPFADIPPDKAQAMIDDAMALAARIGQPASFHTLHYLEGQGQGSSFWPRLIGFQSTADRCGT